MKEIIDHTGRTFSSISEMANFYKIPYNILWQRLRRNWSVKRALLTPVRKYTKVLSIRNEKSTKTDIFDVDESTLSPNDAILFAEFKKDFKKILRDCKQCKFTPNYLRFNFIILCSQVNNICGIWYGKKDRFEDRAIKDMVFSIIERLTFFVKWINPSRKKKPSDRYVNIYEIQEGIKHIYSKLYHSDIEFIIQ